jgi:nucleotide-binding universal stress UspA family protein
MLARLSASFRQTHSDCVVSVGRPADTIASLAVEYEAGLVVMGLANAGDSELRKPGSIAYRVLRIAHVAVVVVPHREAQAAPDQPRAGHDFQSLKRLTQSRPEH